MKRIASLILISAATLWAQQPAPSMVGTWNIAGDVQGYPIDQTCVFTQTGETVGGTCTMETKPYPTTVKVDGMKVVLVHGGEYEGQALTLTFTGTFNDKGELSGTIDVKPLGVDGTFKATKAAAQ